MQREGTKELQLGTNNERSCILRVRFMFSSSAKTSIVDCLFLELGRRRRKLKLMTKMYLVIIVPAILVGEHSGVVEMWQFIVI